eukprot:10795137-Alexandrium_andersonii.AAC.1
MGALLLWDEDVCDLVIQGPRSTFGSPADRVRVLGGPFQALRPGLRRIAAGARRRQLEARRA